MPPPERPADTEVLRQFGACSEESIQSEESNQLPPIDIYLDDSESMQGYVRPKASEYSRIIDFLRSNLATVKCTTAVYRLSDPAKPIKKNWLPEDANYRGFYCAATTPLDSLLTEHVLKNSGISLLITDFVQSTKKEDQQAKLQNALRALTDQKLEIELMGFRSKFVGNYFKESSPKSKYYFYENDHVERPFYLLLVAPNRDTLELFKRALLFGIGTYQTFRPRVQPLNIQNCRHHVPENYEQSAWKRERENHPAQGLTDSTKWLSVFSLRHPKKMIDEPLSILIDFTPELIVLDASRMAVTVEKSTMDRNHMFSPVSVTDVQTVIVEQDIDKQYRMDLNIPRPEPMSWDIYRVRIRGGSSNLGVPDWVVQWNTFNDDNDLSNRGKTLNLLNSVRTMVLNISVNTVILDQYIMVGRGEE